MGTQRDTVHWELLGVELRRENKPYGDWGSSWWAVACSPPRQKKDGNKDSCCIETPTHPPHLKLTWLSPAECEASVPVFWADTLWEPFPSLLDLSLQPFLPSRFFWTSLHISAAKAVSPKEKAWQGEKLEVCQVGVRQLRSEGAGTVHSTKSLSVCQVRVQESASGGWG